MSNGVVSAESATLTDSRLASLCAQAAHRAFLDYEARFRAITQRARERFIARDWRKSYADATERLHLYTNVLSNLTAEVELLMGPRLNDRNVWTAIKAVYSSLIARSAQWEIGESFFNSLTRRVFATAGVDQAIEFVDSDFDAPPTTSPVDVRRFHSDAPLSELLYAALTDPAAGGFPEKCSDNLRHAVRVAAQRVEGAFPIRSSASSDSTAPPRTLSLEIIGSVFYRGRGAYFVGRAIEKCDNGVKLPLALCLRHENERGITLDAVLLGESDLAILFSFTRAYFRVDSDCPYALVRYLWQLMPLKRLADLYNSIGFNRHAKTEFYRDFVRNLQASRDRFAAAEGIAGMVMLVFTLPSYDVVFKLIKDRFDFPKDSTRSEVMRRYRLVFEHDRAGRLVEAHEFEHLRIARERFHPALLEALLRDAAETVRSEGADIVIAHAYVERRVRPLNLFLAEADAATSAAAACDYGQAIKDLAASNIFPGDILTKNFGVTRHGRVVFYDYDELCFLTDCNFRDLPQPTTYEEEISAEPWFSVRENDIFPEEFSQFLGLPKSARNALWQEHGDLFGTDFWRGVQQKLMGGQILEVFPYGPERRLLPSAQPAGRTVVARS
jgi:isocitrate dehydrogenase kinase/phosphatase